MFKVKMSNFKKNKKGVEAAWGTIIMIIAVIASAIVIIWVLKGSASKVDEELQVDTCRISNEIYLGTEKRTPWFTPDLTPRICNTIYKTEEKVPTKSYRGKYKDAKEAAEIEVGDMIKNCWYEWLEGSDEEIFTHYFLWFGRESGCAMCYVFTIDSEINFNTGDLVESMKKRTYSAIDLSDKCAPNGGGFLKENKNWYCGPPVESGWKVVKSKKDKECCVRENAMDECGNKGGKCSDKPDGEFKYEYTKWSCPETNQKCYLTGDSHQTYYEYVTTGKRGGMLSIKSPIDFKKVIAISFHSYRQDVDPTWVELSSFEYAKTACKIIE